MSDFPTLQQELERKALETLQKAVFDYQERRINAAEAYTIIQTVWDVTAGLITKDTMEVVSACQRRFTRPINRNLKIVGLRSDSALVVVRIVGSEVHRKYFQVSHALSMNGSKETLMHKEAITKCETEKGAYDLALSIITKLKKNGFTLDFEF